MLMRDRPLAIDFAEAEALAKPQVDVPSVCRRAIIRLRLWQKATSSPGKETLSQLFYFILTLAMRAASTC
jgi:hypothetical protein